MKGPRTYAEKWGHLVRDIRQEYDMSQRTLSAISGLDRCLVRRIEDGRSGNVEALERLFAVFGYELEAIKVGPGPEPSEHPKPKHLPPKRKPRARKPNTPVDPPVWAAAQAKSET